MNFRKTYNAIFEKKVHKIFWLVLEKLCQIDRKLKLDKINSTSYLIYSNLLIFYSYAIIKLSMQSTSWIPMEKAMNIRAIVKYAGQIQT